jgi:alkylation response protein AidB-like acyl-CoA dehydrogenase
LNFDYTDDQKQRKDEARQFLGARSPLTAARAVLPDVSSDYDAGLWRGITELGWCGAAIPEDYGGIGLGHVELCALAEEIGRALGLPGDVRLDKTAPFKDIRIGP